MGINGKGSYGLTLACHDGKLDNAGKYSAKNIYSYLTLHEKGIVLAANPAGTESGYNQQPHFDK